MATAPDNPPPPPNGEPAPAASPVRCPVCRYDATGLPMVSGRICCPECGTCAKPRVFPAGSPWQWTLVDLLWSTGPGLALSLVGWGCVILGLPALGLLFWFIAMLAAIGTPAIVIDLRRRHRGQGAAWGVFLLGSWALSLVLGLALNSLLFRLIEWL